jgi:predicted small lipoprotein YifL
VRRRLAVLAGLAVACTAGCGQQGPLVLPPDARPVERIDPQPTEPDADDERERDR